MSSRIADVALLTDQRYVVSEATEGDWYLGNILHEDTLLRDALAARGLSSARVAWSDDSVDWSGFRCAVFRSTWDYHERFPEFAAWLNRVESLTRLCNSPAIVRWNMDKHYLADLAEQGIPIVPSRYLEKGDETSLHALMDETGWNDAIVKPCVSATARHTYRVDQATVESVEPIARSLLKSESLIFQPFLENVRSEGEDTLIVFDGQYSHAVRKTPKAGDFRVQDDHGGSVRPLEPEPRQVELALRTMNACRATPSYGRVDMVRDSHDEWRVMEMELIEPELWMRFRPRSAEAFAGAIASQAE
jgi:glutathione synthase/RimK-type ligase-like ATP-grasp enzyme